VARPVVFMVVFEPVGMGLVQSLRRPGGNFTGLASPDAVVAGKRVELLIDALPGLRRLGLLWSPSFLGAEAVLQAGRSAALARGLQVVVREYASADELPDAFAALKQEGAEAVVMQPDNTNYGSRNRLAALALQHRLSSA